MRESRKKIWIDGLQTRLSLRIAFYFALYQLVVWALVIIERHVITGMEAVLSGFFSSTRIFPHHAPSGVLLEKSDAALARLGIAHLASRPVAQMSSGEAKRTLVARALVHEPQTLLFDEPSNALDIGAQIRLRDTMRALAQDGLGILLVTHHVSEIIPEIERVVLLREGRLVDDGPKQEMLTSTKLSALFGADIQIARRDGYFSAF